MRNILETGEFIDGFARITIEVMSYYIDDDNHLILPGIINNKEDEEMFYQIPNDEINENSNSYNSSLFDKYDTGAISHIEAYGEEVGIDGYLVYNYIDKNGLILSKYNFTKANNFKNTEATVELFGYNFTINNLGILEIENDEDWFGNVKKISISNKNENYGYTNYINKQGKIINNKWWAGYYWEMDGCIVHFNYGYNIVRRDNGKIYDNVNYDRVTYLTGGEKIKLTSGGDNIVINTKTRKEVKGIFKYF